MKNKQNVEYHRMEYYSATKKEWRTDACYNVEEPWKHFAKWKTVDVKDHMLYDSGYMNYL